MSQQTEATTARTSQSAKVSILDGLCRLYLRPRSSFWWAVFVHKQREIRASTKQTDLEKAKKVAQEWYYQKRKSIDDGFAPTSQARTFGMAIDNALEMYDEEAKRGTRSQPYVAGLRRIAKLLKLTSIAKADIAAVDQGVWNATKKELLKRNTSMSAKTLHQYKNLIRITLNKAIERNELKEFPRFAREKTRSSEDVTPRTWFKDTEYDELKKALVANTKRHAAGTRPREQAEELYDYVLFVANTGMRIGEAMNVRFCDVTFRTEGKDEVLEIRNIMGKRNTRGHGQCKSFVHAVTPFKRCITRRGLTLDNYANSTEQVFKEYHRDLFKDVLKGCGLYTTKDRIPRRRDLMSMRHTYICLRLLRGVPIYDIAANCRTSVEMIQKHYARHLSVLESTTINKRTWGD